MNARRKRNLSCDSVKSECSGWDPGPRDRSSESRGRTRNRSNDSDDESCHPRSKKGANKECKYLRLPKIILS